MNTEQQNIRLTSAEISQIWGAYMNDSLASCELQYFLAKVEDTDIRPIIEYALDSHNHVYKKLLQFFKKKITLFHMVLRKKM
jgi:hypothetical protein